MLQLHKEFKEKILAQQLPVLEVQTPCTATPPTAAWYFLQPLDRSGDLAAVLFSRAPAGDSAQEVQHRVDLSYHQLHCLQPGHQQGEQPVMLPE